MREITGNIWQFHAKGNWIVIPTNGNIKRDGRAVMGRGLALYAAKKWPKLPWQLGQCMKVFGNVVYGFPNDILKKVDYRILTFPTKKNWPDNADITLIEQSAAYLVAEANIRKLSGPIYLPRVGCGEGGLDWNTVKPVLEKYLDERFIVIDWDGSRPEISSLRAWIDGSCRPVNPGGTARYAIIIKRTDGSELYKTTGIVGTGPGMSNNVAEYAAFFNLLKWLQDNAPDEKILVYSDSALLVNQMQGKWGIKAGLYKQQAINIKRYLQDHKNITLKQIPREENYEADSLLKI